MVRAIVLLWMLFFTHGAMAQAEFTSYYIRAVQQALTDNDYDVGDIDGRFGTATANAIRQYQSDWQLPQTGEISHDLLDRLWGNHPATQAQWLKIENGDCTVWNYSPQAQEIVSWTGGCTNGKVSGSGTLIFRFVHAGGIQESRSEGEFSDGDLDVRYDASDIRRVQRLLTGENYYNFEDVDGRFDEKTAKAIFQYQADWKIPLTGEISRDLIDHLRERHPATQPQWMRLGNKDCMFWELNPQAQETAMWSGGCADGKASGSGKFFITYIHTGDLRPGDRYEGEFSGGKFNGRGVHTLYNGVRYEGEFRDGRLNGRGVQTFADGGRYEGEFRDGEFNGRGVLTFTDGGRYEGEFRDNDFNGHGVQTFADGGRHDGKYRDDKPNGYGTYTNSSGDYSGTWLDGCLSTKSKNLAINTTMQACGF